MKQQTLKLEQINTNDGTQVRALNLDVVGDYRELLTKSPHSLPPVDVYSDGNTFWLADGFHRHEAAKLAGLKTVQATVDQGDRITALTKALGSNVEHGYRRTRADKRNAVLRAMKEFAGRSDRFHAHLCEVSPTYVGTLRKELIPETVQTDSSGAAKGTKRLGCDGKSRKMPQVKQAQGAKPAVNGDADPIQVTPVVNDPPPAQNQNGDDNGHADFESEFTRLDKLCAKVVASAETLLASNRGTQRSQVRSRLNELRADLERLTTGSLPQMERLPLAA